MRKIQFSTNEGLYTLTPWTKSIYGFGQTGVSSISYKIRQHKTQIAASGIITQSGLFSIKDSTKN
jgi:hypothetical protein